MKRRLHTESRLEVYCRWYERRYKTGCDPSAIVEFAWKFPQTAKSAHWFRDAVAELISVIVIGRRTKGKSFRHIAALLNRMHIPPPRADRWYASSVRLHTQRPPNRKLSALKAFRLLCTIYGPRRQDLSWVESAIRSGDSTQEDVCLLWELHRIMKDRFRVLRQDILSRYKRYERQVHAGKAVPRRERLASFVRTCWGTCQLPHSTLRAALLAKGIRDHSILDALFFTPDSKIRSREPYFKGFLDRPFNREELVTLSTGKLDTAVIKIVCRWFRISPRSAYRYKPVQKKGPLGSITVTPLDSD